MDAPKETNRDKKYTSFIDRFLNTFELIENDLLKF